MLEWVAEEQGDEIEVFFGGFICPICYIPVTMCIIGCLDFVSKLQPHSIRIYKKEKREKRKEKRKEKKRKRKKVTLGPRSPYTSGFRRI